MPRLNMLHVGVVRTTEVRAVAATHNMRKMKFTAAEQCTAAERVRAILPAAGTAPVAALLWIDLAAVALGTLDVGGAPQRRRELVQRALEAVMLFNHRVALYRNAEGTPLLAVEGK